jgi:hypothetical protein
VLFTVISTVVVQPAPEEKVIVEVPGMIPRTTPLVAFMVATAGVPLLHTPVSRSVKVAESPGHSWVGPPIGDGRELTVTVYTAGQPDGTV